MKKSIILLLIIFCKLTNPCCQLPVYWQQQVDYKIDVTLNDADNTLDGYISMNYFNNSPDTLHFIWIHIWPNAYKNDRTAFSDQLLENGNTDFYFSGKENRGYINRLDFKVNSTTAKTEDHPVHQDIIKLLLPQPLLPKSSCKIETPFHVKLPFNYSRSGYNDKAYQITQWYPKPAVYDTKGWHPIPYLDQGEFYSEFGNYSVQITSPDNYIIASTGIPQEKNISRQTIKKNTTSQKKKSIPDKKTISVTNNTGHTKTMHFVQNNVHDFAWFADPDFTIKTDTLKLASGRIITVNAYYYSANEEIWLHSIGFIKHAVLTKSKWLGEYPYDVVSVVEDKRNDGGMEYPTITFLSSGGTEKSLDFVINHEVGHNWFYGVLATNERLHPWMDEGMNTYYDSRYMTQQYKTGTADIISVKSKFLKQRMPDDVLQTLLLSLIAVKKDQPIETPSEKFSKLNYNGIVYGKTGMWMQQLEKKLGTAVFDSCMHVYFNRWAFKHPYPEDFKAVFEEISGTNLDSSFALLKTKGTLTNKKTKKDIKLSAFFSYKDADKHHYVFISPAIGFNFYDKKMFGIVLHNYTLPSSRFQFIAASLYSSKSHHLNGIGRIGYSWYPGNNGQRAELSLSGTSFASNIYIDSVNTPHYLRFSKIAPSFKFSFANKDPRSTVSKFIQWKTFIINEQQLLFTRDDILQIDIITYPFTARYLNQLQFVWENTRKLYPYKAAVQAEQGKGFVRLNFTGDYYFNYASEGGLKMRVFAGKFFYLGDKTFAKEFETDIYHLNMSGPKGYEDYNYSNYFVGRNEYDKFSSQQIMIRDGGFKVRTDLLSNKIGKTDNWLAAVNLTTDIPKAINPLRVLPVKLPIKAFFDMGTYAEAWKKEAPTGRIIYDAGLQLSLFKDVVNIYVPLLYSKVYTDYFKSTIPEKRFIKNIAFSIDLQNLSAKKILPQFPF